MSTQELEVIVDQLEQFLIAGTVDTDDALEVATLAGLAERLGADASALQGANTWLHTMGEPLLAEALSELDLEPLTDALDACMGGDLLDEDIEEAFFDLDDLIAALLWMKQAPLATQLSAQMAETIEMAPECFEPLLAYLDGVRQSPLYPSSQEAFAHWDALDPAEPA